MGLFDQDRQTALEAKHEAQRLAFAPVMFQVARIARDRGVLEGIRRRGAEGASLSRLVEEVDLPPYAVKVLVEAGLGIGLFHCNGNRYRLSKLGYFVLSDEMTRVNMDVVHDVCYRGLFHLDQALVEGHPAGLATLGDWPTLYEGLSSLPAQVATSWLRWDHYYSDAAFPVALPLVFDSAPRTLLDIGGNTGRWARACTEFDPEVEVTILDLPQQLELARTELGDHAARDRIRLLARDMLDDSTLIPPGFDVIWMSQFLDCFSLAEIDSILTRVVAAMRAETTLFVLELHWDRQDNETAAFCLQQISIYFSCIANGRSRMYHSDDLAECIESNGLDILERHEGVGGFHTLWACRRSG